MLPFAVPKVSKSCISFPENAAACSEQASKFLYILICNIYIYTHVQQFQHSFKTSINEKYTLGLYSMLVAYCHHVAGTCIHLRYAHGATVVVVLLSGRFAFRVRSEGPTACSTLMLSLDPSRVFGSRKPRRI